MLVGRGKKKSLLAKLFADKAKVQQEGFTTPGLIGKGVLTAAEIAAPWTIEPEKLRQVVGMFHDAGLVTFELGQEIEGGMAKDLAVGMDEGCLKPFLISIVHMNMKIVVLLLSF